MLDQNLIIRTSSVIRSFLVIASKRYTGVYSFNTKLFFYSEGGTNGFHYIHTKAWAYDALEFICFVIHNPNIST